MSTTQVRAKFVCGSRMETAGGDTVIYMYPVYSIDPASENKAWADATPGGQLQMQIGKGKPAADLFVSGKSYFIDITPAE